METDRFVQLFKAIDANNESKQDDLLPVEGGDSLDVVHAHPNVGKTPHLKTSSSIKDGERSKRSLGKQESFA